MFNQIIKTIWNQRTSNAWIWAEMVLVSICLWYIIDDLYTRASLYLSPMGYDISHVYRVDLRTITDENQAYRLQSEYGTTLGEDLLTLVSRMRAYPGVEAVGVSESSVPYSYTSNSSSLTRIKPETNDTLHENSVRRFFALPGFIRVFRYATPNSNTETLAGNLTFNQVIISKEVEDKLYPEGNATGKKFDYNMGDSVEMRVGGVIAPIRFSDFRAYAPTFILPMTEKLIAESLTEVRFESMEITLRVNPSASKDFAINFRKDMKNQLRYNNIYMLNILSYDDIRARYIRSDINDAKMYLAGVFFLLVNIFLGIVGTFFFRTQHRQGEMGLRIALGSTTGNLRSLLINEGLVILILAFIPAAIVSLNIGLKEIVNIEYMPFSIHRFLLCQGITFVLMATMITVGIWFPSRKVVTLQPAEALRYE